MVKPTKRNGTFMLYRSANGGTCAKKQYGDLAVAGGPGESHLPQPAPCTDPKEVDTMQNETIVPSRRKGSRRVQTLDTATNSMVAPLNEPIVISITVPDVRDLTKTVDGTLTMYGDALIPAEQVGAERERSVKIVQATFEIAYTLCMTGTADYAPLYALIDSDKQDLARYAAKQIAEMLVKDGMIPTATEGDSDNAK